MEKDKTRSEVKTAEAQTAHAWKLLAKARAEEVLALKKALAAYQTREQPESVRAVISAGLKIEEAELAWVEAQQALDEAMISESEIANGTWDVAEAAGEGKEAASLHRDIVAISPICRFLLLWATAVLTVLAVVAIVYLIFAPSTAPGQDLEALREVRSAGQGRSLYE